MSTAVPAAGSTLPEAGLDLTAEVTRYRDWLIEQALIRTAGNKARAARLLGLNRTTLVEMLRRSSMTEDDRKALEGVSDGESLDVMAATTALEDSLIEEALARSGGNVAAAAKLTKLPRRYLERKVAAKRSDTEPPTAVHDVPRPLPTLREKIARLKSQGFTVAQIAGHLGQNRFLVEKLLRTPAPLAKCGGQP